MRETLKAKRKFIDGEITIQCCSRYLITLKSLLRYFCLKFEKYSVNSHDSATSLLYCMEI